jgi:hypothetical protein
MVLDEGPYEYHIYDNGNGTYTLTISKNFWPPHYQEDFPSLEAARTSVGYDIPWASKS